MSAIPILTMTNLSKSFGAVRVIHELNVTVFTGEILGVIGPNGAGKTTLFNLISGDVDLDQGVMLFNDHRLTQEAPYQRCHQGIGRTYQIPRPYVGMSVFENLLVAAMFGGKKSEAAANQHCFSVLDECGLLSKANQLAGSLTLLDRKRLELARALASDPKLLLLDEIAGGLTEHESLILVELVRQIKRRQVTVIWIEHVLHALLAVADRLVVLNFGEKVAEGDPKSILEHEDVKRIYMGGSE